MARIGRNPRDYPVFEDASLAPDNDIVVDLGKPEKTPRFRLVGGIDDAQVIDETDSPFGEAPPQDDGDHNANLADQLEPDYLRTLGMEIVELVEQDIADRSPWRERFERGMEMLGLVESDIDDGPFPGASNAVHPLIIDAVNQSWGRAYGELMPPEGPCKPKTQGRQRQEMIDRGERVAEFMNFDMMTGDAGFASEISRMLWALPWVGSAFLKSFKNPVDGQTTTIYAPAEDIILHSSSADLRNTPRFTHRMRKTLNDIRALQISGYYSDIELEAPSSEDTDEVDQVKNEISDVQPSQTHDRDNRLTIYETLIELDLPGHEHKKDGKPTGWELPYYVTVEKETMEILSIRRGWRQDDPTYKRHIQIRKFDFVPGPGPYGLGLFHIVGGLQTAATGALRVMLDGAASASLSGGFVGRNANLKGKRLVFEPGVWQPVDASGEDLSSAFVSPPVKEPSAALFQMLGFITEQGAKVTATTEMMTGGTDSKNAPVGSTIAMIEQGQKVMSTIHRLTHAEFGRVLKDRYDLLAENPPEEGYPYEVDGEERTVYAEDFAPGVEIIPVSDPNIFSSVQRIQIAQAVMESAIANPDVVKKKVAIKRFYRALKVPDVDELIEDDPEAMPYDSNGEIQAIILGKPVKVLPEQNHVAHLHALAAFGQNPQYGGNPLVMQQIGPALITVAQQHLAYAWAAAARQQQVPAGFMDPETGQMSPPEVPPEQLTQMMMQIAPMMQQAPGLPGGEGEGSDPAAEAKVMEVQAKIDGERQKLEMKKEEHQMKMQQEQEKMAWEREKEQLKLQLEQEKAQVKMMAEQMKAQAQQQQMQQQAAMDQQMNEQKMAMDQQNMAQQSQMDQQRMSMESEQMQREGQMREAQMGQEMQHAERKSKLDELRGGPGGGQGGQQRQPGGGGGQDQGGPR